MLQYETACSHSHQPQPPQHQQQQQTRKQTYKEYLQQHQQQKQQQQLLQQQQQQEQQQSKQPVRIFRVHYIRLNSKDGSPRTSATASAAALANASGSSSSSHGCKMKTIAPNIRRRRRCDKHHLELYACNESGASGSSSSNNNNVAGGSNNLTLKPSGLRFRESITAPSTAASSPVDEQLCIPAPPITPPPAFLTEGYKRASTSVSTSALPSATQEQQQQQHQQQRQQLLRPKPLPLAPPKLKPKTTATIAVTINSSRPRGTVKRSLGKLEGRER